MKLIKLIMDAVARQNVVLTLSYYGFRCAMPHTDDGLEIPISILLEKAHGPIETISLVAVGTPSHGTAAIVGEDVVYTKTPGWIGTDSFTATFSDGTNQVQGTIEVTTTKAAFVVGKVNGVDTPMPAFALGTNPVHGYFLCWGVPGLQVAIQRNHTDLKSNSWYDIGTAIAGDDQSICFTDTSPITPTGRAFYRALVSVNNTRNTVPEPVTLTNPENTALKAIPFNSTHNTLITDFGTTSLTDLTSTFTTTTQAANQITLVGAAFGQTLAGAIASLNISAQWAELKLTGSFPGGSISVPFWIELTDINGYLAKYAGGNWADFKTAGFDLLQIESISVDGFDPTQIVRIGLSSGGMSDSVNAILTGLYF